MPIIREISLKSPDYPRLLREIPFPPKSFNIWGVLPETPHYLSIVGTRKYSAYGEEILRKIIAGLAPHGFTIVSGLAKGIDTIAHRACLENNIPTVAVLGSGLSSSALYPPANLKLAEEIASRGGAVISEYDHEMKATLWSFPQRNRIISGLSPATLVIEAPEKSGALITAKFALDQNRDVLAVPGTSFSPNSKGTNKLIKQGAALVESAEDVLKIYNIDFESPGNSMEKDLVLSHEEKIILGSLVDPLDIDSLIRKSKIPTQTAQSVIGLMEIRGIIKKVGNEYFKNT